MRQLSELPPFHSPSMSDSVIQVENLGKKYVLGHQQQGNSRYVALRDVVADGVKSFSSRLRHPLKPRVRPQQDEFWALKDVSFEVKQGEVVGIIGRNGAGKSTLLKILSRITEPTEGRVRLRGRVASLLEVGTGFHPELTGRENIFLNGAILGMSRVEINRKFDEIVDFAEVARFLDTPVKRYSSGMYVRLAFAVAAHLEPEILVVDEVLAVGDAAFQKKCLGKMGDVATKEGRTVLFVSHNMTSIRQLCNKGILLQKGVLAHEGRVIDVIKDYIDSSNHAQYSYDIQPPKDKDIPGYAYRLVIEDESSTPVSSVSLGKPWQVRIFFILKEDVSEFVIGLGFLSNEDMPIRTCWSTEIKLSAGQYQAVFREDTLIFSPGKQSLIVGLSKGNKTFQYSPSAGFLEIEDFSEEKAFIKTSGVGLLLNQMKVEIQNLD